MNAYQQWPSKRELTAEWLSNSIQSNLRINKHSRIISIGSCFAREIKYWLKKNNFNYLEGETAKSPWISQQIFKGDKGRPPTDHASIAWERVYNTFTLEQILRYTFEDPLIEQRLLKVAVGGRECISDILRTRILYPDLDTARDDVQDHINQSRLMFTKADILIITLGLTEVWRSERRKIVIPAHTGKHYSMPEDFSFHESTFEENLASLKRCHGMLKASNPAIKVIVTVSPVHLLSTFRTDVDVLTASCASKSILRSVANAFAKEPDVHYFPSYEIATIFCPIRRIEVYPDNHHVSKAVVDLIMKVFEKTMILRTP